MKKRKGNLLQRMMAVLLSAVLVVGMVAGTAPTEVLAAENTEISESVSENDIPAENTEISESVSGNDMPAENTEISESASENDMAAENTEISESVSENDMAAENTEISESASENDMPGTEQEEPALPEDAETQTTETGVMVTAVQADGDNIKPDAEPQTPEVRYSTDGGSTWTEATLMDAIFGCYNMTNPKIELLRDITLTADNWFYVPVAAKSNSSLTIDGKGKTITCGAGVPGLFAINEPNSKVTLQNIIIDGGAVWSSDDPATRTNTGVARSGNAHLIYVSGGAELVFESGVILQNNDLGNSWDGAAVEVGNEQGEGVGKLIIKDGVQIRNNRAKQGGAIFVYNGGNDKGELIMEGGEIYGNYATLSGGAVCNDSTFRMKGGRIYGNASGNNGGGVCSSKAFYMEGGEISGNRSGAGGGISVFTGDGTITGGSVTGNAVTGTMGGGVLFYDGTLNGTLSVSGDPVIKDNTGKNGAVNNVYLNGKAMSVSDSLNAGAMIGVTTSTKPDADTTVAVTGVNGADYSKYFFSDDVKYQIENTADNTIQLAVNTKTEITPVLSLPESMTIHPKSNTVGDIMSEVMKSLEISGVDGLEKENDYTIAQSYEADTGTYKAFFKLTSAGNENYFVGTGSIAEVECTVQLHSFGTGWSKDESNHWHECTCGAKTEEAVHSFGAWTVIKPAAASEEGLNERSCSVCGYKQTKAISETGGDSSDEGDIEVDKEQGENTPDVAFGMSKDDLIRAVLTPEEQSLVEKGTDIKITLVIDNIDASVSKSDKQAVTEKAGEYKVGEYLDINLYKIIGTDRTKISHTNGKIRIALTIPDSLRNTDSGTTRSYAVVRVHDGAAELLPDLDGAADTITIETDLFSTYALVYKDSTATVISDNKNNDSHTTDTEKDDEPKTGDTTSVEIYATAAMIAGFTYLILFFENMGLGMTEEAKKELTASIIAWAKKGGMLRKIAALAAIFVILFYYHSIGKRTSVNWKQVYGE